MRKIDIQQGSHEWHQARWGNVTGTTLKSAVGKPAVQDTLLYRLVSERMTEVQVSELETPAVLRGQELEAIARQKVIEATGINFSETGLLVSDDISNFSISPDGIYEQDGVIKGGLEIKCPSSKKHVEYLLKKQVPKEYWHQVIAPFVMSDDIEFWLFASYDDRNYERPLFVKKVTRYDISNERQRLRDFLKLADEAHMHLTF